MAYRVSFDLRLGRGVPDQAMSKLRERLHEIAWTIGALAAGSGALDSISAGPMCIQVDGWDFTYTVDPSIREIRVVGAIPRVPR